MRHADEGHDRQVLLEAFTAGWQAALAVTISNPRVLAAVEHGFDLWLLEEADEVDVLGLPFRARIDLPCPADSGEGAYPAPPMQTDGRWTAVRYDVADPDQQADPRVVPAPQCEELETAASSDEAGDTASPPSGATAGSRNGVTARVSSGEHDVTEESKMS